MTPAALLPRRLRPLTDAEIRARIEAWDHRHPRLARTLEAVFAPVDWCLRALSARRRCLVHVWEPLFPCPEGDENGFWEWRELPGLYKRTDICACGACRLRAEKANEYRPDFVYTSLCAEDWERAWHWREFGTLRGMPRLLDAPGGWAAGIAPLRGER